MVEVKRCIMGNPAGEVKNLTYEAAFAELEKIVTALETEESKLEEAIGYFERGQALAKHCAALLDNAELKIQQLSATEIADPEG
jgi:exodeoxyribonuclease VII small subunit